MQRRASLEQPRPSAQEALDVHGEPVARRTAHVVSSQNAVSTHCSVVVHGSPIALRAPHVRPSLTTHAESAPQPAASTQSSAARAQRPPVQRRPA
jgi:hypothetical protein